MYNVSGFESSFTTSFQRLLTGVVSMANVNADAVVSTRIRAAGVTEAALKAGRVAVEQANFVFQAGMGIATWFLAGQAHAVIFVLTNFLAGTGVWRGFTGTHAFEVSLSRQTNGSSFAARIGVAWVSLEASDVAVTANGTELVATRMGIVTLVLANIHAATRYVHTLFDIVLAGVGVVSASGRALECTVFVEANGRTFLARIRVARIDIGAHYGAVLNVAKMAWSARIRFIAEMLATKTEAIHTVLADFVFIANAFTGVAGRETLIGRGSLNTNWRSTVTRIGITDLGIQANGLGLNHLTSLAGCARTDVTRVRQNDRRCGLGVVSILGQIDGRNSDKGKYKEGNAQTVPHKTAWTVWIHFRFIRRRAIFLVRAFNLLEGLVAVGFNVMVGSNFHAV